jgi:RHS repeat-associated protein
MSIGRLNHIIKGVIGNSILLALILFLAIPVQAVEKVRYIHTDSLGSPAAATDESGNLVWREIYRPYGDRALAQTDDNRLWFTGKLEQPDIGLNYFGARWYDPIVGRFAGVDPVGFQEGNIHSFNRYAYANNNPYRYVDPDGNWVEDMVLALPSLVLGSYNFGQNISQGNYLSAVIDIGGMALDIAALALPVVPGGAGYGISASRLGSSSVANKADLLRQGKDVHVKDVKEAREILHSMPELRPGPGNVMPGLRDRRNTYRGDLINTTDPTSPKIHDRGKHANQPHFNIDIRDKNNVRQKPAIFIDD